VAVIDVWLALHVEIQANVMAKGVDCKSPG
jgi:hypothetical protein